MNLKRGLLLGLLSTGLLTTVSSSLAVASPFHDHDRDYGDMRGLIDRVQSDLRSAVDLEHGGKQADRYRNAQDSLSNFDRSLSKGHFDKERLDKAIDDLKHLLDHNTLQASTRESLQRDLDDLRVARERRGR